MSEMREGESILSTTLELLSETMASMSLLMASMAMILRGDPSEMELAENMANQALESAAMKLQRARAAIGPVDEAGHANRRNSQFSACQLMCFCVPPGETILPASKCPVCLRAMRKAVIASEQSGNRGANTAARYCEDKDCGVLMMESSDGSSFWCPRCGTSAFAYETRREIVTFDCLCGHSFDVASRVDAVHGGLECPACGRKRNRIGERIIDQREAPGA